MGIFPNFSRRADDDLDAQDAASAGNEGHVLGALGGIFTPSVVKDAEALMAKADVVLDKADAVIADLKLIADALVEKLGLKT